MSFRNLSPQHMFEQLARQHRPTLSFTGTTRDAFDAWKTEALPAVLETLGKSPPMVDPDPELLAEWEHEGLRKQRWLINVGEHIAATFLINYPGVLEQGEKRRTIFCWHGHGAYGKEPVMGNDSSPEKRHAIAVHNYSYGHQMAKAGFVTFAIDWIGCGERNDSSKPHFRSQNGTRDWCNIYYLHATMLGMTSLSINVTHGKAATNFACTLPHVDPERLGVMGLSGGGTMTLWTTLCDERFRAAEIICYSALWPYFGFRDVNYCGMQVAPGLFDLVHLHDLQGLIAPRPLLVDIGAYDTCFSVDEAMACFRSVQSIYGAAGCAKKVQLDLFPAEHSWGGNRSVAFFEENL